MAGLSTPQRVLSAGRWLTPCVYVVGWPDGVVKVGATLGHRRYRAFELRGASIIRLYWPSIDGWIDLETAIHRSLSVRFPSAFRSLDESLGHLGANGGWTECYQIAPSEWAETFGPDPLSGGAA